MMTVPGKNLNKLILVIRFSGERTFPACRELASRQVPEERIFIVREQPFEVSLRETYKIGLSSGAEWMVTLDADVLLRERAIEFLLMEAEAMPRNIFQLGGKVLDKLSGGFREAGHRIYRTAFLKTALDLVPDNGVQIRPEYATLQRMSELGFPSRIIPRVFGIHDYEQFYRDIYRKAFIHAHKHQVWLAQFIQRWRSQALIDDDFQVALRGLCDGLMCTARVKIDSREFEESARVAMNDLGIEEKSEIDALDYVFVDRAIAESGLKVDQGKYAIFLGRIARVKANYKKMGFFRFAPFLIGSLFCSLGKKLKSLSREK